MNDESSLKHQQADVSFVRSADGLYVAWSLSTPPHSYGEWSLVSIVERVVCGQLKVETTFIRPLTNDEIDHIYAQPYMWWGRKLHDSPWALVECRPQCQVYSQRSRRHRNSSDSIKNTGV